MSLGCVHEVEKEFKRWASNKVDNIGNAVNIAENAAELFELAPKPPKDVGEPIRSLSAWIPGVFSKNRGKTTGVLPQRYIC